MRLRKMVMAHVDSQQAITHGIVCNHTQSIALHETDELVHCIISPEKNADIVFHLEFPESAKMKSYVIQVDFHHEHAKVTLSGLYQLHEKQKANIKTVMNHFVPRCIREQN